MSHYLTGSIARAAIALISLWILFGDPPVISAEVFTNNPGIAEKEGLLLVNQAAPSSKQSPLMLDQIRELVPLLPDVALAGEVESRGINFKIDADILGSLERLGAGPMTIKSLNIFISNRPPTVLISMGQTDIVQGQTLTIYSDVNDPDGDQLQYYWATTAGEVRGGGPVVNLDTSNIPVNPDNASVTVTVTVIDRRGGSDSYSKTIAVSRPRREPKPADAGAEETPVASERAPVEKAWVEGKLIIVEIERGPDRTAQSWGFIEVKLSTAGPRALLHSLTGSLPGVPCRVDFVIRENVSEYSFKEPPGIFNEWRKVLVRIRPKDASKPIRFAITWQVI